MADLRIAHLPIWKPHGQAAGIAAYKGVLFHQAVNIGGTGFVDSIGLMVIIQAESVQNH